MNNPGMDFERWKQLRQKWTELDAKGHKVKVEFQLVAHPQDANNIMAIDVVQQIDGKPVTETVQRNAGEAYEVLGIANLSVEELKEVYRGMMQQLYSQQASPHMFLSISMKPTSPTSGELIGDFARDDAPVQDRVQLNYQHYYVLSALREKMREQTGKSWSEVTASYDSSGNVEFRFEYE